MATVSSNLNPYVIPHTLSDPNPSQTAFNKGVERNTYQHNLVNVSKSGGSKKSKHKGRSRVKKGKKSKSASSSRRKFSRKFRKSLSSRKSMLRRRNKNKKLSRGGGDATMTIPSFSQTTPNGTSIINQLASNHAQTLAYSAFDGDVKISPSTASTAAPSK